MSSRFNIRRTSLILFSAALALLLCSACYLTVLPQLFWGHAESTVQTNGFAINIRVICDLHYQFCKFFR
jgi:hypothetical protein